MIANHLKKKHYIQIDNDIHKVLDYQHLKPGKGGAFVKLKLESITNKGKIFEKTLRSEEKVTVVDVSHVNGKFLYEQNNQMYFLNLETYEEYIIDKKQLEEILNFLLPDVEVFLVLNKDQVLEINLPAIIEAEVMEAETAVKGNSTNNPNKELVLSNGFKIKAPLFIQKGDWISIDTKNGAYITRIQKEK